MSWRNYRGIILAAGLLLTGCRSAIMDQNGPAPVLLPHTQVVALTQKPAGDDGKPLVDPAGSEEDASPSPAAGTALPQAAQYVPIEKLTPLVGSPGVVVCEPVADGADAATAAFGAGCGRWLHLTVGGQAELGQTPLLSSVVRAQTELGRTDLRLSPAEADKMYGILGITHVAVGRISGSAARCTLTYQLYAVPGYRAVGAPVQTTGTEAQTLAQLPRMARTLAAELGVAKPRIPNAVNGGPEDMALLGTLSWFPGDAATPAQVEHLRSLATRLPLAGVLLFSAATPGSSYAQDARQTQTLLAQQPDNPLVWSLVARGAPAQIAPRQAQLARNLQRFPRSYLFAATQTWLQRSLGHPGPEMQWAERTVQYAPHNPDAWLTLGWTVAQAGDDLRQGRVASEITPQEWTFLRSVYPQWLAAVSRSARLDPLYALAWERVAPAATFAGNMTLADHAFWRSVQLQPDEPEAYSWGLQMYQPKWTDAPDAPDKLRKTADLLATTHFSTIPKSLEAVSYLKGDETEGHPFRPLLQSLCASVLTQTQQQIARNPGDAQAHYDQAYLLDSAGRKSEAVIEYKNVLLLRPGDYDTLWRLARLYDDQHRTAEAITEYQKILGRHPSDASIHRKLGRDFKAAGRFPEAEGELKRALSLTPNDGEAHFDLGQVYLEEKHRPEAIGELQAAIKYRPDFPEAYQQLCSLLDEQGQYDASIAAGLHAVRINPQDNITMDNIADDYLNKRAWTTSIRASEAALRVNPQDGLAHLNLGEAYNGAGDRVKARAEWQQTLALDSGEFAKDARANLTKYP